MDAERRIGSSRSLGALVAVLALAGCEGPGLGAGALALGPLDVYAWEVEPVLEARCAQGGCHGRPDRPFVLFAPGVYRADPARTYLAEALSPAEIELNARRVAALAVPSDPESSLALRKPLSIEGGGVYHGGGDVFADRTEGESKMSGHIVQEAIFMVWRLRLWALTGRL